MTRDTKARLRIAVFSTAVFTTILQHTQIPAEARRLKNHTTQSQPAKTAGRKQTSLSQKVQPKPSVANADPNAQIVIPQVDTTPVTSIVQDDTGKIYGIAASPTGLVGKEQEAERYLATWSGSAWVKEPPISWVNGSLLKIASSPTGAVICAWRDGDQNVLLTIHRGGDIRRLGTTVKSFKPEYIFADRENVWLVSMDGYFYRVDMRKGHFGQGKLEYHVDPSRYYADYEGDANDYPVRYTQWQSAIDGYGRICFYMCGWDERNRSATYRGLLVWSGAQMVVHSVIPLVPDKRIASVLPKDRTHLWIALCNGEIYSTDTINYIGQKEKAPNNTLLLRKEKDQKGAGINSHVSILSVFQRDKDIYAFTSSLSSPIPGSTRGDEEDRTRKNIVTLWKYTGKSWQAIIPDVNGSDSYYIPDPGSVLLSQSGLWVGTQNDYIWHIPVKQSMPKHLNSMYRFPLKTVHYLMKQSGSTDRIIAIAKDRKTQTTSTLPDVQIFAKQQMLLSLQSFTLDKPLLQDKRRHLWCLSNKALPGGSTVGTVAEHSLLEWNGHIWKRYKLPQGFQYAGLESFAIDSKDHLWLVMWPVWANQGMSTFIYSPQEGIWRSYKDYTWALAEMANDTKDQYAKDHSTIPFEVSQIGFSTPQFTNTGQVCYLDENNKKIHAFDGDRWHEWSRMDITNDGVDSLFINPPFYDSHKNLSVNIDDYRKIPQVPLQGKETAPNPLQDKDASLTPFRKDDAPEKVTFRWKQTYPPTTEVSENGWLTGPYEAGLEDVSVREQSSEVQVPDGCFKPDFLSACKTKSGDYWFTSNGVLYKYHEKSCTSMVPKGYINQFDSDTKIKNVSIDSTGNAFVEAVCRQQRMYVIIPGAHR